MSLFDTLFGKNKGARELRACEAALEKRPDDALLLKKLGDLYLKANKNEEASDVYLRLGDAYNFKGFYPKAIALYKQAIKINPTWGRPYEKLADLYQLQGFSREAATQFVKLADILDKNGEHEAATMYMQKAADLDPAHASVNKKVQAYDVREKGMMDPIPKTSAQPEVRETDFYDLNSELDKEIEELHISEGEGSTEEIGADDPGVESVFRAIQANAAAEGKEDPLFLYNMGLAYRETGLLDDAIESFNKVIALGEKLMDAHIMLGITYRERGLFKESLSSLRNGACLEEASTDMKVGILYEIAQTYKAMGDNSNALSIFRDIQKEHRDFKDVEVEIVRLAGGG
jgi:tetratricopeptide (TPR) repeat protein